MLLHRIKGTHIGLSAGGILKLDSDTLITVIMICPYIFIVDTWSIYVL